MNCLPARQLSCSFRRSTMRRSGERIPALRNSRTRKPSPISAAWLKRFPNTCLHWTIRSPATRGAGRPSAFLRRRGPFCAPRCARSCILTMFRKGRPSMRLWSLPKPLILPRRLRSSTGCSAASCGRRSPPRRNEVGCPDSDGQRAERPCPGPDRVGSALGRSCRPGRTVQL